MKSAASWFHLPAQPTKAYAGSALLRDGALATLPHGLGQRDLASQSTGGLSLRQRQLICRLKAYQNSASPLRCGLVDSTIRVSHTPPQLLWRTPSPSTKTMSSASCVVIDARSDAREASASPSAQQTRLERWTAPASGCMQRDRDPALPRCGSTWKRRRPCELRAPPTHYRRLFNVRHSAPASSINVTPAESPDCWR